MQQFKLLLIQTIRLFGEINMKNLTESEANFCAEKLAEIKSLEKYVTDKRQELIGALRLIVFQYKLEGNWNLSEDGKSLIAAEEVKKVKNNDSKDI